VKAATAAEFYVFGEEQKQKAASFSTLYSNQGNLLYQKLLEPFVFFDLGLILLFTGYFNSFGSLGLFREIVIDI
jgi:hypothetical protein